MKKLSTKKRFNSKKGISMVLAIALSAVLFLSTTTFLSIAMLQQNETGTTMNSRQAYVSAKSALDMAEELLNDGKLDLPNSGSLYYVFYYLHNDPEIHIEKRTSASGALDFINDPTHSNYTIIGNAYIKITKNDDGTYTITAVGAENKYTGKEDNTGDLSATFDITYRWEKTETETDLTMSEKKISTTPTAGGTSFFMLGDQTAFSLLKSQISKTLNQNFDFRTIQGQEDTQMDKYGLAYILRNEAEKTPISSYFPLVFDKAVKITSNSNSRCRAIAYDNGIYLLGKYSSPNIKASTDSDLKDVCLYTSSDAYGVTLECKYLVISGNMACKTSSGQKGAAVKYAGSNYSNDKGVVINFTKNVTCTNTNTGATVSYNRGYYFLPISEAENQVGIDLFDSNTPNKLIEITNFSTDNHYKSLNGIDVYSSMLDSNGNLKNMHSAYEAKTSSSSEPVSFLYNNGKFNTEDNKVYTTNQKTNYYDGWKDYYIYCAPSEMPTVNQSSYIDLYAGQEFNYLWYNVNKMEVNSNVNINIRSKSVVLSIGPDQGEEVYYNRNFKDNNGNEKYPYSFNQTNAPSSSFINNSETNKSTITSLGSNKIKQNDASASFSVMPYWNESSFTLTVINDFSVELANGNTYTVKAGKYTDISSTGLNLFSPEAQTYFNNHTTNRDDADDSSIDWVRGNSINENVADNKLDQSNSVVDFKASNGGTLKNNGTYTAKAIYCDFGNTVKGNNATLKADVVAIGADKIDGSGNNGLFINSYGGYSDSKCQLVTTTTTTDSNGNTQTTTNYSNVNGSLLHITKDTTLILDDGLEYKLDEGYYYFPNVTDRFNILSSSFWQNWNNTNNPYYYAETLDMSNHLGKSINNNKVADKVSFEGKYF